ncbi:hypothetical protein NDU88_008586 [Pleurodeles waltl]|uniref:Uncharacterized protein n=1 Tax=Pleurodeles waltl TaxID=8319 RepID=A0AAV7NWN5_PLEWA|nr:hypothetical protein NDU88_008586 [Pleurodeles waltl]
MRKQNRQQQPPQDTAAGEGLPLPNRRDVAGPGQLARPRNRGAPCPKPGTSRGRQRADSPEQRRQQPEEEGSGDPQRSTDPDDQEVPLSQYRSGWCSACEADSWQLKQHRKRRLSQFRFPLL